MALEINTVETVNTKTVKLYALENMFVAGVLVEKGMPFTCMEDTGKSLIGYKRASTEKPVVPVIVEEKQEPVQQEVTKKAKDQKPANQPDPS